MLSQFLCFFYADTKVSYTFTKKKTIYLESSSVFMRVEYGSTVFYVSEA